MASRGHEVDYENESPFEMDEYFELEHLVWDAFMVAYAMRNDAIDQNNGKSARSYSLCQNAINEDILSTNGVHMDVSYPSSHDHEGTSQYMIESPMQDPHKDFSGGVG